MTVRDSVFSGLNIAGIETMGNRCTKDLEEVSKCCYEEGEELDTAPKILAPE